VDFKERFKGKTSVINKDGHIGVARDTHHAIPKPEPTPLHKRRELPFPNRLEAVRQSVPAFKQENSPLLMASN
jgi:hypothetical protein